MNRVRLAFCVLIFGGLSVAGLAKQEQATPVVTAAAPVDKVRFAGSPTAVQMRIEVRSASGTLLFDSDWKDGNILDWLPQDGSGQPLAYGAYRLVLRSKNLAGQTSEKQASLHVDAGGIAVDNQPGATPKITLTAHDGETGELITTSGDLSFRFGDFLNRKDTEAMRLTAAGDLNVNGLIRAKGIVLPDGTILTTASGSVPSGGDGGSVTRQRPSALTTSAIQNRETDVRQRLLLLNPPAVSAPRLTPRPNTGPANQFVVDSAGVHIGTTNAYGLDVAGNVTLASNLALPTTTPGGTAGVITLGVYPFAHNFGTENTFLGAGAGNFTTTGMGDNTASGFLALVNNTSGYGNTATGSRALQSNTNGSQNTASGYQALYLNTSGGNNTASGYQTLYSNTTGIQNTASGYLALYGNTTGGDNTASGRGALSSNTTGYFNIAVGFNAGSNLTTGNNNIDIGNQGIAAEAGIIRIGTSGTHAATFIAGIRGASVGPDGVNVVIDSNGQLGTALGVISSRRYKFDINSMGAATDDLMRLRPVTFRYLAHGDNAPIQYGLIAEEVAEVYPEMVTRNKDGEPEAVIYQFLAPMLLNEVQTEHRRTAEQQKTIEEQQKTIDALSTTLLQLGRRLQALERQSGPSN